MPVDRVSADDFDATWDGFFLDRNPREIAADIMNMILDEMVIGIEDSDEGPRLDVSLTDLGEKCPGKKFNIESDILADSDMSDCRALVKWLNDFYERLDAKNA